MAAALDPARSPEGSDDAFEELVESVRPLREALVDHEVYGLLESRDALQRFMELHVYAVVDFMCLLKSLQQRLTVTSVPWFPPPNTAAARFINEIVVAEESDIARNGAGYITHYDMYLDAMRDAGADTGPVESFVELVRNRQHYRRALKHSDVPDEAAAFVKRTMSVCLTGKNHEIASFFVVGREDLIPDMFRRIVAGLNARHPGNFDGMLYYLDRHIEIDSGEHGPLAAAMLRDLCGDIPRRWKQARAAAEKALQGRIALWDAAAARIRRG